MGWLILGGLLLLAGLYNSLWSMFGLTFEKEDPWNDRRLYTVSGRVIATVLGVLLVSFNFPDIIEGVSNPGWLIGGILLFIICGFAWFWKQFDPLVWNKRERYADESTPGKFDEAYAQGFMIIRIIGMCAAVLCISVGIGTGAPAWESVNQAETPPAVEEQVQEEK